MFWLYNEESLCMDFLSIFCLIYKYSSPGMLWREARTSFDFTDTDMDPNILQNKLYLLMRAHLIDELLFEGRHGHYLGIIVDGG